MKHIGLDNVFRGRLFTFAAFASIALLSGSAGFAQNLLSNGDFNTPDSISSPTNWTTWSYGGGWANHQTNTPPSLAADGVDGTWYMACGGSSSAGGGVYQIVPGTPGLIYTLSVDSGAQAWWLPYAEMRIFFQDATNGTIAFFKQSTVDPAVYGGLYDIPHPWSNYTLVAAAPANTAFVKTEFAEPNGAGTAWFDNAVLTTSSTIQATIRTYDGFNYPPTGQTTIDNQNGGLGWDANWGQFLGGAVGYVVTNGSLSDPTATLYTSSNRVYSTGSFAGRYFTEPTVFYGTPGTTNFFSMLIRPESTPATNHYYGLQLFSDDRDTGFGHDVFVGKNGASLYYGLEYSTNDVTGGTNVFIHSYSSTAAVSNQTVFLVVRVVFADPTGEDSFSLYVNPTPGGTEPVTPDATLSVDIGAQNGLALNSGNGAHVSFDEIRMGSTFAAVTSTTSSPADLLTYEPFAYSATGAASLDGQPNNGTQAADGWANVTWGQGTGGAGSYSIASGSLFDPSGKLVTSGNRTTTQGGFAGRYNSFPGYGAAGSTGYFSILIRPEDAPNATNYCGLQLFSNSGQGDLLVGKNGSGFNWGLEHGATNAYSSVACTVSQTVFLVVRGDYTAGNDTFRLYVNPTPGAPEPAIADATLTYDIGTQNGLGFTAGAGGRASFDEIRVGTQYADVSPVAASDFRILSITNAGNSIVLTWITTGGHADVVQTANGFNGSFATNGFADISPPIIIPGTSAVTTNYVDPFGATNRPARYYRIRHP
jgi:hypothetical protein